MKKNILENKWIRKNVRKIIDEMIRQRTFLLGGKEDLHPRNVRGLHRWSNEYDLEKSLRWSRKKK